MALALSTEDASSVLESFIHDTANLPAEIAHLLEEMAAKDETLSQLRAQINSADMTLQRYVKTKGQSAPAHASEESLQRTATEAFAKCHVLQDEKVALANKASSLLDRHVKRLDLKIRDLATDGALVHDPSLPSLLHASEGNRVNASASGASTGVNTPLHHSQLHQHSSHINARELLANASGSSTNMANTGMNMAHMLRVAHQNNMSASAAASATAPAAAMQPHPLLSGGGHGGGGGGRYREMSASSDGKRRRLNGSMGPVGVGASGLARHSSLGPGTPKAGTPGLGGAGTGTSSRAGSVGPRTKKAGLKKVPPHVASGLARRRMGSAPTRGGMSKKSRRRAMAGKNKGADSESGDDESSDSDEGSDEEGENSHVSGGIPSKDGAADEDDTEMMGVDEEDTKLYCFCKKVSHGDMVACDNDNCPYEWFHWGCVGLTQEPKGRWLCPDCRKLPPKMVKYAR